MSQVVIAWLLTPVAAATCCTNADPLRPPQVLWNCEVPANAKPTAWAAYTV